MQALSNDNFLEEQRIETLESLLYFTKVFYRLRTGREYIVSKPISRESHHITICKALTKVLNGETKQLLISVPPRYGKTELLLNFIAWGLAHNPQSNFIYTSYSYLMAQHQASFIRDIIRLKEYRDIFGIELNTNSNAKGDFSVKQGGCVYAAGAGGSITGRGAGIYKSKDWSGCIVIDDPHKPDEAFSDTIREGVSDWYYNTVQSRRNAGKQTPVIVIGQRVHEEDLIGTLAATGEWDIINLPALDAANNALNPEIHSKEDLLKMKEEQQYVFASQYQQNPIPAGGAVFKKHWFHTLDAMPEILTSFITVDTAETDQTYNDATVFSLWGIYKVKIEGIETDQYALHWIDCQQDWLEPKDLEDSLKQFYARALVNKLNPAAIAIEKKSTGVSLISALKEIQSIDLIEIERNAASKTKANRFNTIQPYIARRLITLPAYGKHTKMCIEHMGKITLNDSHRYDDIADTVVDAVRLALIDKTMINLFVRKNEKYSEQNKVMTNILSNHNEIIKMRNDRWQM